MTSYFLFQKELRRKHEEEGSSIDGKEFSKLAAAKWKTLDDAEKKKYKDQYDVLMVEYKEKKSDYDKENADREISASSDSDGDGDSDNERKEKKKRKKKDPNAPKKPMSSYFLFQTELRRKHKEEESSIRGKEFSKLAAAKWKTLDEAEKKRYKDQYDALMVEYKKKKSDYDKKPSGEAARVAPDSNQDGEADADADADSESSRQ